MGNVFTDFVPNFRVAYKTPVTPTVATELIGSNPSRVLLQIANCGSSILYIGFRPDISVNRFNFLLPANSDRILIWKDWGAIMQGSIYGFVTFAGSNILITEVIWVEDKKQTKKKIVI